MYESKPVLQSRTGCSRGFNVTEMDQALKTLLSAIRKDSRPNPFDKIFAGANEDLRAQFTGRAWLISGLMVAMLATGVLAVLLPPGTYGPLLSAEIFGGVATFLLFLQLHTLIPGRWIPPVLVLAFGGAVGAYFLEGGWRELGAALSVGAILAIALDQGIKSLFERMQKEISKRYDTAYDEFSLEVGKLAVEHARAATPPLSAQAPGAPVADTTKGSAKSA